MKALATVLREVFGLFVDDGMLAAAILGWVVAMLLIARLGFTDAAWSGPAFFAGLAVILVGSVLARARR